MLVISDLHLSCNRTGGTTPASQQALRNYLRSSLSTLLDQHKGEHVVCNGDLFDNFQVDTSELILAYEIFAKHLQDGALTLVMGNHDGSAKGSKVSSFHLLSHFLQVLAPSKFRMIDNNDGFTELYGNVFVISHQLNQSLFDLEIEKAVAYDGKGKYLLLHCNVKNGFSEHSDHSLNINDGQLGNLMRAGWHIVVGHEHQGYELRSGRVIVVGNQVPSSVSDCIGDDVKNALIIDASGHRYVETWEAFNEYTEIDWRELAAGTAAPDDHRFIRVVGDATSLEAAETIKTVSALRQRHPAFVISSAVKIDGAEAISEMADVGADGVKAFDVLSAIYEQLEPLEVEAVKGLLI